MIRQPPRSTLSSSSAASDVYKRQVLNHSGLHHSSTRSLRDSCLDRLGSVTKLPILSLPAAASNRCPAHSGLWRCWSSSRDKHTGNSTCLLYTSPSPRDS
eukprot:TRINITY_DN18772_c0_g1_i6.p1 TRINITY_DN18772_c0_g1~~TRINITY_DN18772_c0_g1_i6.p1  ORF type:complete len:100 (+),score=16.62 TRINITY_DN18772_c0_g1_i6:135-434(+)